MIIHRAAAFLLLSLCVTSCVTMKQNLHNRSVTKSIEKDALFQGHFTGFILHDPTTQENLVEINADKYFAPASNVKLLTFYGCLVALGDSIPGLIYEVRDDTLFFTGTGDPTLLWPDFDNQPVFDLLAETTHTLAYIQPDFKDEVHEAGWTWEDYEYYYQVERSGFPLYGNALNFLYDTTHHQFDIAPPFFEDHVELFATYNKSYAHARHIDANIFQFAPDTSRSDYKNRVPFKTSDELTVALLQDTLHRPIVRLRHHDFEQPNIKYSTESKDLYALMLKRSDNFIAEQLQYIATQALGLDMRSASFRNHILLHALYDYRNQVIWKDGSGLSRYNLVTPRFMIALLNETLKKISMEEFKALLPNGGQDGTIRNYYKPSSGDEPYVFAKTGTLSNNHNLTGIIRTQSGRDLLFTFMNNNYKGSSYPVKIEMEKILRAIHEKY
ncbi:hypothetical protein BFP72_03080 [Reichenbachiella sp. 5M10]|uniref:D-alanyl-D-alanine carboxypeptidase n=1 Tax=Reichenbachiella sp. 5M10 TaxID=1889772 RepID=UPI000C527737|nr:D-alanyl-D-alanine carboxypeptidase [Reichenbachiella sp. 5M10]PIB37370.1 hypothetical protein BFP72_03080 [Reichenbachiella sp. 5M10]